MKIRIKTYNGELPNNLTVNKVYDAVRVDSERMRVICDDGQVITTNINKSGYLGMDENGGSWEIINE